MSWDYIFTVMKPMLEGAQMTIFMFLVAIVLSVPFGFGITLIMRSRFKPLAWIAHMYV
ncbi:amino acid ABC transporter permease, partial [Clostridioides difficile]